MWSDYNQNTSSSVNIYTDNDKQRLKSDNILWIIHEAVDRAEAL